MSKQPFYPAGAATQTPPPSRLHVISHRRRRRTRPLGFLLLLFLALPAAVKAEDYNYTTNNGAITITQYVGSDDAVTIPDTINGLPVISVGDQAFLGYANLTSITIPNGVTSIGSWAFWSCSSLTNVSIPDSVTNMGDWAFWSCSSLASVKISNRLSGIGFGAFQNCSSLTNLAIPDGVTSIGDWAFANCTSLTSAAIGNSLTSVGTTAFYSCTNLTSVTILGSVTNIGDLAFFSCTSLTGVYFQGNAPGIGADVFSGATNAIIYYVTGTADWGATFGGRPTALWIPPAQASITDIGVRTNQFGFTITGTSNLVIVVEACTNLTTLAWVHLQTNTLSGGPLYFSDSQWTNSPRRYYRLRAP